MVSLDAGSQRFETPGSGLTPFGSSKMISELVRFQGDNGLEQDGIMHPQGPTHQKTAELLGTRGIDAVDGTRPLQSAPFEPKPTKSIASLEKAERSLMKDVGTGKPGTALKIKQLHDEKRLAERNRGQTGFKTVKVNPLTGLAEKVKPERPKSPPKPILPQPQTMAMKQSPLPKGETAKFNLDSPLGKQFMSAFADMKAGKPVPRANLNNLPDRVAEARGPDLQTMELRWGDQTEPEGPKPHNMNKDPLKYARNLSAGTSGSEGGEAKPNTPTSSPDTSGGNADGDWEFSGLDKRQYSDSGKSPASSSSPPQLVSPFDGAKLRTNTGTGDGFFGANRTDKKSPNGKRPHNGIDILGAPGTDVTATVSGVVTKINGATHRDGKMGYVEITDKNGHRVRHFYVEGGANLKNGDIVRAGETKIGKLQDMSSYYKEFQKTPGMDNHLHLEIKSEKGRYIDPTGLMPWLKK